MTRTREDARVDAFVAAIRRSADCHELCAQPVDPPTVELPAVVAVASTRPEPDEVALVDRLPLLALVVLFVAVFAPLVVLLGVDAAPSLPAPAVVEVLDTADEVTELGSGRIAR